MSWRNQVERLRLDRRNSFGRLTQLLSGYDQRQSDLDHQSGWLAVECRDFSSVETHSPLGNGQTQADTTRLPAACLVESAQGLFHSAKVVVRSKKVRRQSSEGLFRLAEVLVRLEKAVDRLEKVVGRRAQALFRLDVALFLSAEVLFRFAQVPSRLTPSLFKSARDLFQSAEGVDLSSKALLRSTKVGFMSSKVLLRLASTERRHSRDLR